jgi:geranylgeranylglycerol-phosphate geranylgeranyltransferase
MHPLLPYLKIIRPCNALLSGIAVALGFWLGHSALPIVSLLLLMLAGIAAAAFGNVVNDLKDVVTDRISHPDRPLPSGTMSTRAAAMYASALGLLAPLAALPVSAVHLIATLIPLVLLLLYAFLLKRTPLTGNVIVSLLVAYALLFGGIGSPLFPRLIIPAGLAFLLNCIREIMKDVQDEEGDRAAGMVTTTALPMPVIRSIVVCLSLAYAFLLFLPLNLHQFGWVYGLICAVIVLPMHVYWHFRFSGRGWRVRLPLLSSLIKREMAAGLLALAADETSRSFRG